MTKKEISDDLKTIADKICSEIERDEVKEPTIKRSALVGYSKWMARCGYEMSPFTVGVLLDYLKGYNLCLCGRVGVGKTFFFECMNQIRRQSNVGPMAMLSMIETQGWTMDVAREWISDHSNMDIVLDDVGAEPEMCSYGMKVELLPYIIEMRMRRCGRRTHITSNLGPGDILSRYGKRVSDRFVQFFKMEEFTSRSSRRKLKAWKEIPEVGIVI